MEKSIPSKWVWASDLQDGTYRNPVLYADYSDPDVIRVGGDFFMVASSFSFMPGLPVLHSKDLVNWRVISYAVQRLPFPNYDQPEYGKGVWAPSIRFHDNWFRVFFSTPDEGIFMTTSADPFKGWEPLTHVKQTRGWIDPCPFWDDDGKAWLVNAFAKSRIGFKSILHLSPMKPDGTALLDEGVYIFDGTLKHPTIEGPKMYKRNGFYYIFAPAGGVKSGWQTVLRSTSIHGPYEDKIVLHQGGTDINGPHQGGWVDTEAGGHWFIHFQDRDAYGRITHLQPMRWVDDWPFIGEELIEDGIGEPIQRYKKPVEVQCPVQVPETSDNFEGEHLGMQWQWNANPQPCWFSLKERQGFLRLYNGNWSNVEKPLLYHTPNMLTQLFQGPAFSACVKLQFFPAQTGDMAGLAVLGNEYAAVVIERASKGNRIVFLQGAVDEGVETREELGEAEGALPARNRCSDNRGEMGFESDNTIFFRVTVHEGGFCTFSYSFDGECFIEVKHSFVAVPGAWVGARIGIFARNVQTANSFGHADFDWFRVEK